MTPVLPQLSQYIAFFFFLSSLASLLHLFVIDYFPTEIALPQLATTLTSHHSAIGKQQLKSEGSSLPFWFWLEQLQPPWSRSGESARGGFMRLWIIFGVDCCCFENSHFGKYCSSNIHFGEKNRNFSANHLHWQMAAAPCVGWIRGLVLPKLFKKHHLFCSGWWCCVSEPPLTPTGQLFSPQSHSGHFFILLLEFGHIGTRWAAWMEWLLLLNIHHEWVSEWTPKKMGN